MIKHRQIILDTETTGLQPEEGHRIIEIGCIELINRRMTNHHFHYYINPDHKIERGAEEIHGITEAFLQDKPRFEEIVEAFLNYVKGAELIIHNAPFDVGFINSELKRWNKKSQLITDYCQIVDTLALARKKHPGQRNNLDALCQRYNVDNSNRQLHGALLDAELLAQIYLLMTGGQTYLFEVEEQKTSLEEGLSDVHRLSADREVLSVIYANAEELQAHEQFMQILKNDAKNE